MNPGLLYARRGRWMFWIAFVCAIGIHLGAVAIAKSKLQSTKIVSFSPAEGDVELLQPEPDLPSQPQSIAPAPPEQIPPDQNVLREGNVPRRPVRTRLSNSAKHISLVRGNTALLRSLPATVLYAPRPVYPYEARRQRIAGSGVVLFTLDPITGDVINVTILQSCGSAILDKATLDAFRRWRFKPGSVSSIQVPITYTLLGALY